MFVAEDGALSFQYFTKEPARVSTSRITFYHVHREEDGHKNAKPNWHHQLSNLKHREMGQVQVTPKPDSSSDVE